MQFSRNSPTVHSRVATSFLEVQISIVLLGIATASMAPVMVTQLRQSNRLQEQLPENIVHYVNTPTNPWTARLGGRASLTTTRSLEIVGLKAPVPPSEIVDDGDLRFYQSGIWKRGYEAEAINGTITVAPAGEYTSLCLWEFIGIRPQHYIVQVTWPAASGAATDSLFEVYDAVRYVDFTLVDQTRVPNGEYDKGVKWQTIGTYWIDTGSIWIVLWSRLSGDVRADAIRIIPAAYELSLSGVDSSIEGQTLTVRTTTTPIAP